MPCHDRDGIKPQERHGPGSGPLGEQGRGPETPPIGLITKRSNVKMRSCAKCRRLVPGARVGPAYLSPTTSNGLRALYLAEVPGDHGGRMEPDVCTLTKPQAHNVLVPSGPFLEAPNVPPEQLSVL